MYNLFVAVRALQKRLADAHVPSIVIGGLAVGVWGDPRATRDADLKVLLQRKDADRLLTILDPAYVSLLPDPRDAIRRQGMVFVQDAGGVRLDLLLAETPYDVLAIERGRDIEIQPGIVLRVCSPEDLIIYKLISTRARDHEDAGTVIRRQGASLDDTYALDWLRQFEIALDDSTLVAEYRGLRRKFGR